MTGTVIFRLVTRIQDEAHRFAIEYHRSLRSKEQVHSVLDDIKGIGPARRRALMKAFQTLDDLKAASEEELAQVEGMNSLSARQVYESFPCCEAELNVLNFYYMKAGNGSAA